MNNLEKIKTRITGKKIHKILMWVSCFLWCSRVNGVESEGFFHPSTPNIKEQILLSSPHAFHTNVLGGGGGEKLLKYQENSPWVITSLILMTSGVE